MKDNCFFDTSIIIYCYTTTEPEKRKKARALVDSHSFISLQVIQEFVNVLKKKFNKDSSEILSAIQELTQAFTMHQNSLTTVLRATEISSRHQYAFYDSLIIAAALEAGCDRLYSEDLHNKHVVEKRLTIINPFVKDSL